MSFAPLSSGGVASLPGLPHLPTQPQTVPGAGEGLTAAAAPNVSSALPVSFPHFPQAPPMSGTKRNFNLKGLHAYLVL